MRSAAQLSWASYRLNKTKFQLDDKQRKNLPAHISDDSFAQARDGLSLAVAQLMADLADLRAYALNVHIMPCVVALLDAYRTIKSRSNQMDFGDIEWMCYQLLHDESCAAYIQVQLDARYKHLLFDEFQDTNPL